MTVFILPSMASFFLSLRESLTIRMGWAFNNKKKTGVEDMSTIELTPSFKKFANPHLPGGQTVNSFSEEGYKEVSDRSGPQIKELLADFDMAGGNKEDYFRGIHESNQGSEVDRHLVFQALDYARERNLFPVAINVYLESALDHEFINNVLSYFRHHEISTSNGVLELLEHGKAPDPDADFSALELAVENGLLLALDDVDPRIHQERIEMLAPHCRYLKLDRNAVRDYKHGKYDGLSNAVWEIHHKYGSLIVAEGERPDSVVTQTMPIHATQKRGLQLVA